MPRVVSFIVLLAIIMLIGSMFFQVMVQFIVPLFLAAVLVVVFKPFHLWMLERIPDRPRVTAALTTLAIVLAVLLPICGLLVRAVSEGATLYHEFYERQAAAQQRELFVRDQAELSDEASDGEEAAAKPSVYHTVIDQVVQAINPTLERLDLHQLNSDHLQTYATEQLQSVAAPLALGGVKVLGSTLIGLAIMVLTMYYFFSDGPSMAKALMRLSPLDDEYEQELLDKFGDISRAVVVATLASAFVQGILAGFGYWVAGVDMVFLLTALTAFMSMVPFVGAAAIWIPVCLGLYFYNGNPEYPDGRPLAALALAVYCLAVVSTVDNVIKPWVLHGQSKLHPLLALLSVIGGVQALGPIGILVGPMLVAFLQALLGMLNKELHLLGQEADNHGTPVVFATGEGEAEQSSLTASANESKQSKKKKNKKKS